MSPGSSTESYPAFAHIGLRENPGKNLNQDVEVKAWGGNKRGIEEEEEDEEEEEGNRKKDRDRNKAETSSKERSEPATAEDIAMLVDTIKNVGR
ncbi:hypothetical protein ANN_23301 [Periplaneta americana]|uniref:Uncharacterized protein n=1 Tax=Periplaneta americana TaxID=6978 RepID=A0ABQ8SL57_PERAM|nr:hypothetical protein ANN_23301 [Periplaneta americana]